MCHAKVKDDMKSFITTREGSLDYFDLSAGQMAVLLDNEEIPPNIINILPILQFLCSED